MLRALTEVTAAGAPVRRRRTGDPGRWISDALEAIQLAERAKSQGQPEEAAGRNWASRLGCGLPHKKGTVGGARRLAKP